MPEFRKFYPSERINSSEKRKFLTIVSAVSCRHPGEAERRAEQLADIGNVLRLVPGQDGKERLPGGAVFRDVRRVAVAQDVMHQQIDCQYGFTRAGATLNKDCAFMLSGVLSGRGRSGREGLLWKTSGYFLNSVNGCTNCSETLLYSSE